MEIYKKLAQMQDKLFVPKGQDNDFGGYKYRSCEDILKKAKPLAKEVNCVLTITNELIHIGDENYVEATIRLIDLENNEEIVSKAQAREEKTKKGMDGSQITGASSSYARKYALAGLFCIDNEKDSDATNKGDDSAFPPRPEMLKCAKKHYPDGSDELNALLKLWKINTLDDATNTQLMTLWSKYGNKGKN